MKFKITITNSFSSNTYIVQADTLDELKTAFLKRFGNIYNCSNKSFMEKPLVKKLTYSANSIKEWMDLIRYETDRWDLEIILIN